MARTVEEWRGKTDDAKVPDRVKLRIWLREKGRCHLTGRKIEQGDSWDLDHKVALCNGGVHAESNLFPALRDKHREKTAADVKEKARIDRLAKRAAGIRKPTKFRKAPSDVRYEPGPHGLRAVRGDAR